MRNNLLLALSALCVLLCCTAPASAFSDLRKRGSKKERAAGAKKPGKYEKLFEKGVEKRASGAFATLHKVNGKLYLEFPLELLGREMLLSSATVQTSDSRFCIVGYRTRTPMHLRFTVRDTLLTILRVNARPDRPDDGDPQAAALAAQNFADPVWEGCRILAYNPDSTALVFDATKLLSDCSDPAMEPVSPHIGTYDLYFTPDKKLTSILELGAYDKSLSVTTRFSGRTSVKDKGVVMYEKYPLTVTARRTLLLLPGNKMKPRISDQRVGVFLTSKQRFPDGSPTETYTLANRWRLEPSDPAAYARGERVKPVEPIVFYLDSLFPPAWKGAIRRGVLRWNDAFGRIGFADAVEVRDFPADDPAFDPDNLEYSCIRYVPSQVENAMGPSWVDPATGEIINASILICNDVIRLAAAWRFLQTAQVDERVRTADIPEELLMETLSGVAAHEAGHCLGLMHNMAASSAFPTDSLRSAAFTRKYGITPSIMDYARFNYVAQPGDKGVRLAPSDLGVYDYYAIEWLYRWYPGDKSVREEQAEGEKLIDAKEGDPMYRYAPQQVLSRYDPSVVEEDLGDDAVKSGAYGVSNLKLIAAGMDDWIGGGDPDYKLRKDLFRKMVDQYHRYIYTAMHNVGGIRLDNSRRSVGEGTRFVSTPASVQEASLRWVLRELSDCDWLVMKAHATGYPLGYYQNYMQETLFESMRKRLISLCAGVTLSSYLAQEEPFTVGDYLDVVYEELWENVVGQKPLTPSCRIMQRHSIVLLNSKIKAMGGHALFMLAYAPDDADLELFGLDRAAAEESASLGKGYGWQPTIDVAALDETETAFFTLLTKLRTLLTERMPRVAEDEKTYYRAMLYSVEQMIGSRNLK